MLPVLLISLLAASGASPADEPVGEIPIPFLTVLGQGVLMARPYTHTQHLAFIGDRTRTDAFLTGGGGGRLVAHVDFGSYVVPYLDGSFAAGGTTTFDGSVGIIAGARLLTALSLVGIQRKESVQGNYVTVTETKTTLRWGPTKYPLLIGGQLGVGVVGFGPSFVPKLGEFPGQNIPSYLAPRLEVGASLLGQHHVSVLLTVDFISAVVGMRGHIWQRIPLGGVVWLAFGLSYDVAFNNRTQRPYDFMVSGTFGLGFSR